MIKLHKINTYMPSMIYIIFNYVIVINAIVICVLRLLTYYFYYYGVVELINTFNEYLMRGMGYRNIYPPYTC